MAEGDRTQQQVTVITECRNLKAQPFMSSEDQISTGKAWEEWLEGIEREFRYFNISDPMSQKDAMIIFGGRELARLEKSLPDPTGPGLNVYTKLRTKLNDYFMPKRNKHYSRYQFLNMRTTASETTAAYAARLREKANECDFGDTLEDRILEHIIQTIENPTLIQKCITKGWNLNQFLLEASQMEDTSLQVRDMRPYSDRGTVARIHGYGDHQRERGTGTQRVEQRFHDGNQRRDRYTRGIQHPCNYCGRTGYHAAGRDCPAYGKECRHCGRMNHFESVCKSKAKNTSGEMQESNNKKQQHEMFKQKRDFVKKTTEEVDSSESDDEFISHAVHHMSQIKKIKSSNSMSKTIALTMNEIDVRVEPDSGADVNLMDEYQFKALVHRSETKPVLQSSQMKLSTLQNELPVKGEFATTLRNQTRETRAKIIVICGHINSPPLISKESLIELGMLEIREDGSLGKANDMKIQNEAQNIYRSREEKTSQRDGMVNYMDRAATSDEKAENNSMNMNIVDRSKEVRNERGSTSTHSRRTPTCGRTSINTKTTQREATSMNIISKSTTRDKSPNRTGGIRTTDVEVTTSSASAIKQIQKRGESDHIRTQRTSTQQ